MFIDLYVREMHLGQHNGHAHILSDALGITYDHYLKLEPFYMELYGGAARNWGGHNHHSRTIQISLALGLPKKNWKSGLRNSRTLFLVAKSSLKPNQISCTTIATKW
jgi:hypothetical protein